MDKSYWISKTLVERLSQEELDELFADRRSVDLGWWTRFYGIERMSEEQRQQLVEKDIEELEEEWRTELDPLKMAELLSEYADGFYRGTCDLLNCFAQKTLFSDSEALPALFLAYQFAELALKASIQYMVFFRRELGRPTKEPKLNTHDLSLLLSELAGLFEPEEPFLSEDTQEFILKIHDINEVSQAFRYPFSSRERKGKQIDQVFLVNAPLVPMNIFKAEFEIHGWELDVFHSWLGRGYIYAEQSEDESD